MPCIDFWHRSQETRSDTPTSDFELWESCEGLRVGGMFEIKIANPTRQSLAFAARWRHSVWTAAAAGGVGGPSALKVAQAGHRFFLGDRPKSGFAVGFRGKPPNKGYCQKKESRMRNSKRGRRSAAAGLQFLFPSRCRGAK